MRDAPRVAGVGRVLLARDLLAGRDVPQAEPRRQLAAVALDPAGQHELRVDRLPGVEIGPRVRDRSTASRGRSRG